MGSLAIVPFCLVAILGLLDEKCIREDRTVTRSRSKRSR